MESLIFWYTGATVWLLIGLAFVVLSSVVFSLGLVHAWRTAYRWKVLTFLSRMPPISREEIGPIRSAFTATCARYGDPFEKTKTPALRWLADFAERYARIVENARHEQVAAIDPKPSIDPAPTNPNRPKE